MTRQLIVEQGRKMRPRTLEAYIIRAHYSDDDEHECDRRGEMRTEKNVFGPMVTPLHSCLFSYCFRVALVGIYEMASD